MNADQRWLLAVAPPIGFGEWTDATQSLAEALSDLAGEDLVPVRAVASGWLRPPARTPIAPPGFRDVVIVCSTGWEDPAQLPLLEAAREAGARIVFYLHDLTPLRRPEWFAAEHTERFTTWVTAMLGLARLVIVPSSATHRELEALRKRAGLPDFGTKRVRPGDTVLPHSATQVIGSEQFALIAAPLDARIGQAMVLSAWRRLGAHFLPGTLPKLLLAGPQGQMVGDLRERLQRGLPDVEYRPDASPEEISALLNTCLFAIHPASQEGWGFVVSEALARGTPVFAANSGGLPDAGQRAPRYFDPLDPDDLARQVERTLRDPHDLQRWRKEITRQFKPRSWRDAAEELLATAITLA